MTAHTLTTEPGLHLAAVTAVVAHGITQSEITTGAACLAGLYYLCAIADFVRNWKPSQGMSAGTLLTKAAAIWKQDKPVVAAVAMLGFAAASYMHVQIPEWLWFVAGSLGIVTVRGLVRPDPTQIAAAIATVLQAAQSPASPTQAGAAIAAVAQSTTAPPGTPVK